MGRGPPSTNCGQAATHSWRRTRHLGRASVFFNGRGLSHGRGAWRPQQIRTRDVTVALFRNRRRWGDEGDRVIAGVVRGCRRATLARGATARGLSKSLAGGAGPKSPSLEGAGIVWRRALSIMSSVPVLPRIAAAPIEEPRLRRNRGCCGLRTGALSGLHESSGRGPKMVRRIPTSMQARFPTRQLRE